MEYLPLWCWLILMRAILVRHPEICQGCPHPDVDSEPIHGYHAKDWHRAFLFIRSWWRKQADGRKVNRGEGTSKAQGNQPQREDFENMQWCRSSTKTRKGRGSPSSTTWRCPSTRFVTPPSTHAHSCSVLRLDPDKSATLKKGPTIQDLARRLLLSLGSNLC